MFFVVKEKYIIFGLYMSAEEMSINMEFRNVVFNAARDGKLRRLKVRLFYLVIEFFF